MAAQAEQSVMVKPGILVRDGQKIPLRVIVPGIGLIPAEGCSVPRDFFVRRRIAQGDLVVVEEPATKTTTSAAKG